jgi:hypothetical protein
MLRIQRDIIIKWGWRDGQMLRHSGKLEPVFLLGIRMAVPYIYIYIYRVLFQTTVGRSISTTLMVSVHKWRVFTAFKLKISRKTRANYNTKLIADNLELPLWWSSSPMTELRERADSMRNAMTWRWPFSQVRVCK